MGQKIHPLGFRLGVTRNYRSQWFSHGEHYPQLLREDQLIREQILKAFPNAHIAEIKIKRHLNLEKSGTERSTKQDKRGENPRSIYTMGITTPGSLVIDIRARNLEALLGIMLKEDYRISEFATDLSKRLERCRRKPAYLNSGWSKYPTTYYDSLKRVEKEKRPLEEIVFYVGKPRTPSCHAFCIADYLVTELEERRRVRCNAKLIFATFKKKYKLYRKELIRRRRNSFFKARKYVNKPQVTHRQAVERRATAFQQAKDSKLLLQSEGELTPPFATLLKEKEALKAISRLEKYFANRRNAKSCHIVKRIGVKVQLSGRLNGAEIAKTQWSRKGRVPLQTLKADIDYSYQTARTIYGLIGIKVWVHREENKPRLHGHIFPYCKNDTPVWVPPTVYDDLQPCVESRLSCAESSLPPVKKGRKVAQLETSGTNQPSGSSTV